MARILGLDKIRIGVWPDMEKHPSSLASLAEIFWGFGGNIFKWLPLFCDAFGGKQKKLDII